MEYEEAKAEAVDGENTLLYFQLGPEPSAEDVFYHYSEGVHPAIPRVGEHLTIASRLYIVDKVVHSYHWETFVGPGGSAAQTMRHGIHILTVPE